MLAIGLMSGTSADGVDAALVRIEWEEAIPNIQLLAFDTYPYPTEVREEVLAVSDAKTGTVDRVCRLNFLLGELFAEAALQIAGRGNVPADEVAVIGSHGQTIHHLPIRQGGPPPGSTLQIAEPAVIAERTGITTVANFRPRDMAAGGEGAPLSPYGHYLLFGRGGVARSIHNIGGISNLTFLPASGDPTAIIAFDTGPGNMLLDGIIALATEGRERYDRDGALAAQGQVYTPLLQQLLTHPYLQRTPPKTTGREEFGAGYIQTIWEKGKECHLSLADLMATVTVFTAETMVQSYQRFLLPSHALTEVLLCGGGSKNTTLCRHIAAGLAPILVTTTAAYQIDPDALEAVIFALLACETLAGKPGNLPAATGASRPVVLGNITPGHNWQQGLRVLSEGTAGNGFSAPQRRFSLS
jgi:anhydro-N-acetylmuramic acid kinase